MKKTLALFALGVALFAQKPTPDAKAEQAVRAAMDQFAKAVLGKDRPTLERLMSDAILYSHSDGHLDTKASFIDNVMGEKPKYEAFDYGSETAILIYGKTAVVRGRITVKDFQNKLRRTIELNALQVWEKGPLGWTMIARQATRLNP
jgi:ketosteroid isomerase-like protein